MAEKVGDRYIVIPFHETPPETLDGAANVFIVETSYADGAAQIAFDHGYPRCAIIQAEVFHDEEPEEPKPK